MRGTFTALRWGAGFIVLAAVLGAVAGVVRGMELASANHYRQQGLTYLASWIVLDNAQSSMLRWAVVALALIGLIVVSWPLMRLVFGSWKRGLIGAVASIPVLCAYLFAAWYANRFFLPEFRSVASVIGNLLLAAAAVALWLGIVRIIEKVKLGDRVGWCGALARPLPVIVMLIAVLGVQTAHALVRPTAEVNPARPNVLIVLIDALRPDRLGAYGYRRDTSPHLDRFARESWLFTEAVTTAPWTKPAVASLLTGLPPRQHGISSATQWSRRDEQGVAQVAALSRRLTTLPEWLANAGYATGAFGENHHLVAKLGFDQGFDVHRMDLIDQSLPEAISRRLGLGIADEWSARSHQRNTARNIDRHFLDWQADAGRPFFAYVHHIDVHWPYRAPAPFATRFGARRTTTDFNTTEFYSAVGPERANAEIAPQIDPGVLQDMSDAYDAGIAFVDAELGALFDELKKRKVYDSSLIVVTADHGEQFLEHGEIGHGTSLHDVLLRVPLMIKFPCPGAHCSARRIEEQVQLVDVVPTILAALGMEVPQDLPGRNLAEQVDADRVVYAEKGNQVALRTRDYKMIYHVDESRTELFALRSDPGEQNDLTASEPQLSAALRDRLVGWLEEAEQQAAAPREEVSADAEMLDRLKALGYVE